MRLTPTLSYFDFPRREFGHPEPCAKCLLRVHAEAPSHQELLIELNVISALPGTCDSLLLGSEDGQAPTGPLGGGPELAADGTYAGEQENPDQLAPIPL